MTHAELITALTGAFSELRRDMNHEAKEAIAKVILKVAEDGAAVLRASTESGRQAQTEEYLAHCRSEAPRDLNADLQRAAAEEALKQETIGGLILKNFGVMPKRLEVEHLIEWSDRAAGVLACGHSAYTKAEMLAHKTKCKGIVNYQ